MATQLGAAIARCALGPLTYAGSLVMAGRVPDGLRELAPDSLAGGLERGVREAAERAGVKPRDVQRLLPWSDVERVVEDLGVSQPAAVEAWQAHAGQIGGLMSGVADLTVDGRVPDVSLCLERLAKKVSRDRPLAEPLRALAVDIARWQDLVATCRVAIDDGGVLARAYRMRRLRFALVGASALAVVASLVVLGLRLHAVRARVDAGLAQADPCTDAIAPADLERASDDQKARVAERRRTCAAERARLEQQRRLEAEHKAREEEERRVREARENACRQLAVDAEKGAAFTAEDRTAAGAAAALYERIGRRELVESDFGPGAPKYPCGDSRAATLVVQAFEHAVVQGRWFEVDVFSDVVASVLKKNVAALRKKDKFTFGARADKEARHAVEGGAREEIVRAATLCTMANALGVERKGFCPAARTFAKRP